MLEVLDLNRPRKRRPTPREQRQQRIRNRVKKCVLRCLNYYLKLGIGASWWEEAFLRENGQRYAMAFRAVRMRIAHGFSGNGLNSTCYMRKAPELLAFLRELEAKGEIRIIEAPDRQRAKLYLALP